MINLAATLLGLLTDACAGVETTIQLNDDRPTRDTMSIEEATISNMWEMAATVKVLGGKGFCRKASD